MTDTATVTALRPAKAKDATNALRQRRHRAKRKTTPAPVTVPVPLVEIAAPGKACDFKPDVTVSAQPAVRYAGGTLLRSRPR